MANTPMKRRRIPDGERKKNLIAVRLTDEELKALEQIAEAENLSVAYFVRQGIKMVVEKRLKQ
jgi:predicted transcriptional regulator